jgi:maltose alpha-D-glucosyltransferase / alpha-amylase
MIEDLWYKNTVIYSLDLETLMDANGDGVEDFEGLTRRLEYLQALGISTIWLSPFQPRQRLRHLRLLRRRPASRLER